MLHACVVPVAHILYHSMLGHDLYIVACESTFPSTSVARVWPFDITASVACERYKSMECTKSTLQKTRPKP